MEYQTLQVRFEPNVCFVRLHRPQQNNAINQQMVDECGRVLAQCVLQSGVVVFEGSASCFCNGADFEEASVGTGQRSSSAPGSRSIYDVWMSMVEGPYVTVAHVRGKVNAGGVGFVSACDIVLADTNATFGLSEMLFGVYPACVMPFLIRRVGYPRANYLALTTGSIDAAKASTWGLVDAHADDSERLLQQHLVRLNCISKRSIENYKKYVAALYGDLAQYKLKSTEANRAMFSDPQVLSGITRYLREGRLPWDR